MTENRAPSRSNPTPGASRAVWTNALLERIGDSEREAEGCDAETLIEGLAADAGDELEGARSEGGGGSDAKLGVEPEPLEAEVVQVLVEHVPDAHRRHAVEIGEHRPAPGEFGTNGAAVTEPSLEEASEGLGPAHGDELVEGHRLVSQRIGKRCDHAQAQHPAA